MRGDCSVLDIRRFKAWIWAWTEDEMNAGPGVFGLLGTESLGAFSVFLLAPNEGVPVIESSGWL